MSRPDRRPNPRPPEGGPKGGDVHHGATVHAPPVVPPLGDEIRGEIQGEIRGEVRDEIRVAILITAGLLFPLPGWSYPTSGIYVHSTPAVELNVLDSAIQLTAMPYAGGLGLLDGHIRLPLPLSDRPFDWPVKLHGLVGAHIQGKTSPPWTIGINYGGRISYFPITPLGIHLQVSNTHWFMEAVGMSFRGEAGVSWLFDRGLSVGVGYQFWGVASPFQETVGAFQQGAVVGFNWQLSEAFDF